MTNNNTSTNPDTGHMQISHCPVCGSDYATADQVNANSGKYTKTSTVQAQINKAVREALDEVNDTIKLEIPIHPDGSEILDAINSIKERYKDGES